MRKFIVAIITAIVFGTAVVNAQTNDYRTTEFAIGARNSYGSISWGDWEKSNVKLTIDLDNDVIWIYSPKIQKYIVYAVGDEVNDKNGTSLDCLAYDKDGGRCQIRFRIQNDGTSQLYVFYNDVAWVYNIIRV